MNFERIGAAHPLFDASLALYEASFPPNERRTRDDHLRALQDADFVPLGAVEDGRLPGYEDSPVNNDGRYFYYQLCKEVTFNKPTAPGNVLIENTTGNTCDMQVEYQLEDGTVIYTSPMLEPDQHLLEDKLSVELPEGTYDVLAKIYVYNRDTGELQDDFSENITVVVKNQLF